MILPYKTDAPVYHWPFATAGLILVNAIARRGLMAKAERLRREGAIEVDLGD